MIDMITYSEVINMHEVVIKMAFLVLKKLYISPIFGKMTAKTHLCQIILKIHQTKQENFSANLNHINFVN